LIDSVSCSAQEILEQNPMEFFGSLYENHDKFVECYAISDKQTSPNMFSLPPLPVEHLQDALSRIYYKERSNRGSSPMYGSFNAEDDFYDDDEEE